MLGFRMVNIPVATCLLVFSFGCKAKPSPSSGLQPTSVPRTVAPRPAFDDSVPAVVAAPVVSVPRRARRPAQAALNQPVTVNSEVPDEVQRAQDERLLKQQEEASKKQQEEQNQTVQQSIKITQQMQNEQRIQDAPGPPPPPQGIQDDPSVPLAPPTQPAPQP